MINNERTAVYPRNEKEALELIGKFYKRGYKWDERTGYTEEVTNYAYHGHDTSYYVTNGIIQFSDKDSCIKHGYHIIPYK